MKVGLPSKTMNQNSIISAKQSEATRGVAQSYYGALSPVHNFLTVESEGKSLLASECSYSSPSPFIRTESLSSTHTQGSSGQPQKYLLKSGPNSPLSPGSHVQNSKSTFSRSSVFCTSLYQSSSSSSEAHWQLGNLPFLPHPPSYNQSISAVDSTKAPLLYSEDIDSQYDEEHSEALMRDFLNFPGDASGSSLHGVNCASDDGLAYTEQLDLQFLSDELDLAITDHGENPRLDVSIFIRPLKEGFFS
jgi:hypothetical protein